MHPLSLHLLCVCVWVSLSLTFSMHSNNFTRNLQLYERNNNNNNIMWKRGKKTETKLNTQIKDQSIKKTNAEMSRVQSYKWERTSRNGNLQLHPNNCCFASMLQCQCHQWEWFLMCVCVKTAIPIKYTTQQPYSSMFWVPNTKVISFFGLSFSLYHSNSMPVRWQRE